VFFSSIVIDAWFNPAYIKNDAVSGKIKFSFIFQEPRLTSFPNKNPLSSIYKLSPTYIIRLLIIWLLILP
jgi:hypothetical protein